MPAWRHGSQRLLPMEPVPLLEVGAPVRTASPDANMTAACRGWQTQGGGCTPGWPSATPMWGNHRWRRSGQGRHMLKGHKGQMCAHYSVVLHCTPQGSSTIIYGVYIYSSVESITVNSWVIIAFRLGLLVELGIGLESTLRKHAQLGQQCICIVLCLKVLRM